MKMILGLIFVANVLFANAEPFRAISSQFIEELNEIDKDWVAGKNFDEDIPKEQLLALLGTLDESEDMRLPIKVPQLSEGKLLPSSYDPRSSFLSCPSIREVRNQANCGSCWAFGAVEVMTDRTCMLSDGQQRFHYSANDLLSCCSSCGFGCDGGYPSMAFNYWARNGIVSGGSYGSNEGCQPYTKDSCYTLNPDCLSITPACTESCIWSYPISYKNDLHYGANVYGVPSDEYSIKVELFENGPIEASLDIYEDFYDYKSGVYHHVYGSYLGGHAVKMIGYGEEFGVPYWLLTNSWDYSWGDGGFFKIRRRDECGIQTGLVTGIPKL